MRDKLFSPGQEVTLIENRPESDWVVHEGPSCGPMPKYGEIYTVDHYTQILGDQWYMVLKELHPEDEFNDDAFAPVAPAESIAELLEEPAHV